MTHQSCISALSVTICTLFSAPCLQSATLRQLTALLLSQWSPLAIWASTLFYWSTDVDLQVCLVHSFEGLTENDGHKNDWPSKLQGMKLQDMKLTDQCAVSRCFALLHQLLQIRRWVPTDTLRKMLVSLVLTWLDFSNNILAGLQVYLTRRLQSVLNAAARFDIITSADATTSLTRSLSALRVPE